MIIRGNTLMYCKNPPPQQNYSVYCTAVQYNNVYIVTIHTQVVLRFLKAEAYNTDATRYSKCQEIYA